MAVVVPHRFTVALFLTTLGMLAGLSTGCQHAPPVMADASPPANFGGAATLHAPVAPPPVAPQQVVPQVTQHQPAYAKATPGIPHDWIPYAPANHWRWIVIHHSATTVGGAVRFDKEHREVRHFDELGYHFVIGNGTDTPDGKVEVGPRWPKQKHGAHAQTPDEQFNNYGIGICLVGDFDHQNPSSAQLANLTKLVTYLMRSYRIPASHVIGHSDTKPTDCPGRNVHIAQVRQMCIQMLADTGQGAIPMEPPIRTASADGELLFATDRR